MPVFHFRLEDSESGEFRNVSVAADSQDEALATIERQEAKKVAYQADDIAGLEQRLKEGTLTGRDKARLFSHRQQKPYKVKKEAK